MKDVLEVVAKLLFFGAVLAGCAWYSCQVYTECREAGGGALLCWHMMGAGR